MIPFILNDDPTRLVQISMDGSVGQAGKNVDADVRLIQSMLNKVPAASGGPSTKLAVDGRIGPKTIAAITTFQRANKRKTDGRIDVAGPTITALGRFLISNNLLPNDVAGIGTPDVRVQSALTGRSVAPSVRSVTGRGSHTPLGVTDWRFSSSSGVSIGALLFGVSAMKFHLQKDSQPGFTRIFPWAGFGVGLSTLPVGLDISFADMPSFGLRLRQGGFRGSNPMPEDDYQGPCTVYSIGANLGVGFAGTLCLFGSAGPLLFTTLAIGAIAGMEVGIPSAAITGFFGVVGPAEN